MKKMENKKPEVAEVCIHYYEEFKNNLTGFDEWFSDMMDSEFEKVYPRAEELADWLYDNSPEINRERELALATLIVRGPDAVTVLDEPTWVFFDPRLHNKLGAFLGRSYLNRKYYAWVDPYSNGMANERFDINLTEDELHRAKLEDILTNPHILKFKTESEWKAWLDSTPFDN